MKLLVTGRGGQLVRSVVEQASSFAGLEVVLAGRPEVDLEVPGSADAFIRRASPDLVINAAAYTAVDQAEDEPERAMRINADAAGEVAAAAAAHGVPVIQVSTDYVFDGSIDGAWREDAATAPLNVYGASKLAGEERVRAANPAHLILRTSWVYSQFGCNFVRTIVGAARERDVLTVVADQFGCPTSALDLAGALLKIAGEWESGSTTGMGETYHLASPTPTSWFGLAEQVVAECRRRGHPAAEVRPIPTSQWPTRAKRPANSALDSGKFTRDFGFGLPDWRVTLGLVVDRLVPASARA